ncbi:MAG: T9SS type A sorting domain-containing protein [Mariniphaga sp.]|nr:T9SS type A sorting domain-containing protein [Mariniphaga sp.]
MFPNPVKENKFTVSAKKSIKLIRMHNIMGQKTEFELQKKNRNNFNVIFKEKKKGIYLVTVLFDDNSKEVRRIVVN